MDFYEDLFKQLLGLESENLTLRSLACDILAGGQDWSTFTGVVADENGDEFQLKLMIRRGKAWLTNGWCRVSPMASLAFNIDPSTVVVARSKRTKEWFSPQ